MNDKLRTASDESFYREALGKNAILVIDGGLQEDSRLYSALSDPCLQQRSRHSHRLLFYSAAEMGNGADEKMMRSVFRLDPAEANPARNEALLHQCGAVLNWDALIQPLMFCRLLRYYYPWLPLFILHQDHDLVPSPTEFSRHVLGFAPRFFSGATVYREIAEEIWRELDEVIDCYLEAPYWEALKRYASDPITNFHSLPIGQNSSSSPSFSDFTTFYGEWQFNAETPLSTAPLDSLLNPRGAIKTAQLKAATAFGAALDQRAPASDCGTRFVTCGTSSANRIVISAFVQPGDFVLIDRNCHVSHHYALANAHARPVFLKTFCNTQGISGPVPLEAIMLGMHELLERENRFPALIILTNPTFDGLSYHPDKVISAVCSVVSDFWARHRGTVQFSRLINLLRRFNTDDVLEAAENARDARPFLKAALRSIVFLFDEAWSAASFFHPGLIEFTAMHASLTLNQDNGTNCENAFRIYSTQSTHKRLSAFRQGSMIHFRDPLMSIPEFRDTFEQSYRAHTTTSPSASIIASLDVARRQAQLEGAQLMDNCLHLARLFRSAYERRPGTHPTHSFFVISAAEMMTSADPNAPDLLPDDFFLDPTHITISWSFPVDGAKMRQLFLNNNILVNKYDQRSVLAIFNIGMLPANLESLCKTLDALTIQLAQEYPEDLDNEIRSWVLPDFSGFCGGYDLGFWTKNLGGYKRSLLDVDQACREFQQAGSRSVNHVSATFVTPYPPGYPVLVPGQMISIAELMYLRDMAFHEVLGAERVDGRLKIPVFVVKREYGIPSQ